VAGQKKAGRARARHWGTEDDRSLLRPSARQRGLGKTDRQAMKEKPKVDCPICGLVVALKNGGLFFPRHRRRWREQPGDSRICPASEQSVDRVACATKERRMA